MKALNEVSCMLKENNCKPRLIYPAKLSFISEGEIKTLLDKKN
jgi:hypothetical protein